MTFMPTQKELEGVLGGSCIRPCHIVLVGDTVQVPIKLTRPSAAPLEFLGRHRQGAETPAPPAGAAPPVEHVFARQIRPRNSRAVPRPGGGRGSV